MNIIQNYEMEYELRTFLRNEKTTVQQTEWTEYVQTMCANRTPVSRIKYTGRGKDNLEHQIDYL